MLAFLFQLCYNGVNTGELINNFAWVKQNKNKMKQVESLSYMIDKARNELRNEAGEYRKATIREKIAILYLKARKEALKLAFAVVVTEAVMVGVFHYALNWGILELLQPKTVIINIAKPAQAKEVEPKQEVKERSVNDLLDIIHEHETNSGKATKGLDVTCKAKGLSNQYGYNPPKCYKDNATVEKIVIDWIERHRAEGMNDSELLSHYSNGAYTK